MICASPAKPASRRRSGGWPARASTALQPRIERDQRRDAGVEIGFGVDVSGHARGRHAPRRRGHPGNSTIDGLMRKSGEYWIVRLRGRCTSEYAAANDTTRFPLRAVAQRLSASRPCAVRADRFRDGAGDRAGAFCCAWRISTRRAAGRNSRRRSTRISPGSASRGKQPVRRQSEHLDAYRERWRSSRRRGSSIRASRAAARSRGWWRSARRRPPGRAIRMARRSIRATRRS